MALLFLFVLLFPLSLLPVRETLYDKRLKKVKYNILEQGKHTFSVETPMQLMLSITRISSELRSATSNRFSFSAPLTLSCEAKKARINRILSFALNIETVGNPEGG